LRNGRGAGIRRTFAKHFLGDIVEFALELVEQLVDSCGELALGIGVLELVSGSSVLGLVGGKKLVPAVTEKTPRW
jgi:hypothetical protein